MGWGSSRWGTIRWGSGPISGLISIASAISAVGSVGASALGIRNISASLLSTASIANLRERMALIGEVC